MGISIGVILGLIFGILSWFIWVWFRGIMTGIWEFFGFCGRSGVVGLVMVIFGRIIGGWVGCRVVVKIWLFRFFVVIWDLYIVFFK